MQAGVAAALAAVLGCGMRKRALGGDRHPWDFMLRLDRIVQPTALASDPETALLASIAVRVGGFLFLINLFVFELIPTTTRPRSSCRCQNRRK